MIFSGSLNDPVFLDIFVSKCYNYNIKPKGSNAVTITSTRKGGKIVLSLSGRIDIYSADEFEIFTANILSDIEEETVIVLDCRDLIYISSAGLRVVLSAYKALKRKNGRLEVINASPEIIEIFTITGFIKILNIADEEKEQ